MNDLIERPAYPLRRTMEAAWASLGPIASELSPHDFRRVPEFATIESLAPRGRVVCMINGEFISRRDWWQPVRAGDVIVFQDIRAIHGGGGDDGGSDVKRTLLLIVVAVAAYFTGGYAAAAYGGANTAAGAAAGFAASTAVTIGGTLLVNAILPLPSQASGFTNPAAASPTYSVSGAGNTARIGQSTVVRYGTEFFYPDFGAPPYSEFDDEDDQYYCAVLELGYGHFNVLQVTIDDTDIRSFEDVEVAICGPGAAARLQPFQSFDTLAEQSLVEANIVSATEVAGISLTSNGWIGAFVAETAGRQSDRTLIDLVFPAGVGSVNASTGSISSYSITVQVALRLVNDVGQPIGGWVVQPDIVVTAATRDALRRSYAFDHAAGRYQVRIRRTVPRDDNTLVLSDLFWAGLRARLSTPGITRADCTHLVVRMRASEQLSGLSQRKVGVLAERLIPVYDADTETWSEPVATRNPAHAFADILHDVTEGRGLPDSRIDLLTLSELAETYAARQDRFDYSFDSRRTVNEALQLVARAGRARVVLRRGAVFSMVRDEEQTECVGIFVPRNMQRDSFSLSVRLATEETPDCVRMEYRSGRTWQTSYVYAQIVDGAVVYYPSNPDGSPQRPVGVPEPQRVQDERIAGVIGEKHALREVVFLVADAIFRPVNCTWKTGIEGLLPAVGSLVGTAHDVAGWGQSGDVANWTAGTLTLDTTEPLVWTPGETHYVRLQTDTGGATEAIIVTQGAGDRQMVLAEGPAAAPVFDASDRERTRYLFGALRDVTRYTRIRSIRPESQTDVVLSAVLEDVRAHQADLPLLPAPGEIQDPLSTGLPASGAEAVDFVVTLTSQNGLYYADSSGDNRIRYYEFQNDGALLLVVASANEYLVPLNWLSGQPVSPASCALFELRCTLIEGVLNGISAAPGVWLSLGTTRHFEPATGQPYVVMLIEIRDVATQTLQASASLRADP